MRNAFAQVALAPCCGINALQRCLHSNNMNQGGSGFNQHKRLQEFVCGQLEEQTKGLLEVTTRVTNRQRLTHTLTCAQASFEFGCLFPNPLVSSYGCANSTRGCAYSRDSGQYACVVSDPPRSRSVFLHLPFAKRNAKVKSNLYNKKAMGISASGCS